MKKTLFNLLFATFLVVGTPALSWAGPCIQTNPGLPPGDLCEYVGDQHQYPGFNIDDPIHDAFRDSQIFGNEDLDGDLLFDDTREIFNSDFSGLFQGITPFTLVGSVEVHLFDYNDGDLGTFQTEIVAMDLSGDVGGNFVEIRESLTQASTGVTSITDIGGGLFQIDSFFDVFTEVQINGGGWIASVGSTRMVLTPEPATLAVFGSGLVLLGLRRRRRLAA